MIDFLHSPDYFGNCCSLVELYEQHGAQEYWILDPIGQYMEVWQRLPDDFVLRGVFGAGETLDSPLFGQQTIDLNAIFSD
jgi:Uma2 family endonuclease